MKIALLLGYIAELICTIIMIIVYDGVFLVSPILTILFMGTVYIIIFIIKREIKRKKLFLMLHVIIIIAVPIILFFIRPEYTPLEAYKILVSENTELADNDKKEEEVTSSEDDNIFHLSYYYFKFTFIEEDDDGVTTYENSIYIFNPWTGEYFELSE